jgi:hypothetical protein
MVLFFLHELDGKDTLRQRLWREEPLATNPTTFRYFLWLDVSFRQSPWRDVPSAAGCGGM